MPEGLMSWFSDILEGNTPPALTQLVSAGLPPALPAEPPNFSSGSVPFPSEGKGYTFNNAGGGLANAATPTPPAGGLASATGRYIPGVNAPIPYQPQGASGCAALGAGCSWLNIIPCWDRIWCQISEQFEAVLTVLESDLERLLIRVGENFLGLIVVFVGIYLVFRPQINSAVRTGAKVALL
jgi:hypothetical protein